MSKNDKYREAVIVHLQYIKEKVDANHEHLLRLNGRVVKNERAITKIFAIGSTISFIFTLILTYLGIRE